ncbi:MAG: agmatinase [Proteobacteria bacterium]|nr:agmatinase [Pseudomonadota bacterium]MBU1058421.1 agmatinase [Pseudomonadota bacterium]
MNNVLAQEETPLYYGAKPADRLVAGCLNIVGVCYDGTACFRKGAAQGPDAIRRVSSDLETYSPHLDLDLTEIPSYYDLGNLGVSQSDNTDEDCRKIHATFADLTRDVDFKNDNTRFLALGGEHSISYPFVSKYLQAYPYLVLIHLDAHADLRDGYEGNIFSHASIIRRCLDHFGPFHRLVQFGIRSGTREEFAWMRQEKTLFDSFSQFSVWLQELSREQPIYLTLDLDYFDPAFLPGTGTPEADGEDFRSFLDILAILRSKNLVGADVVELAPAIDSTGNSAVFAAKIVRELILTFHGNSEDDCFYEGALHD